MQGPSAIALRQGGQGGALKYKVGVQVVVTIANGGPPPAAWKRKTTLQEAFGEFGQVLEIHTQEDGTAIVEFEDKRDALDASETMNGKKIAGVNVSVEVRQDGAGRGSVRTGIDDRITEMAHRHQLDATSTARLISAFRDRGRRGCNLDHDIKLLSDHLAASNKPSALVCMKLADLRDGKPIGPCRYVHGKDDDKRDDGARGGGEDRRPQDRNRDRESQRDKKQEKTRSRSRRHSREEDRERDRKGDRDRSKERRR
mmetsp:Transcript_28887/g.73324  ORF Transcript_28887/g.73324 Transcript_28887/m.73324 type:complete len:256 (-) Transcript_28887:80-847(-)